MRTPTPAPRLPRLAGIQVEDEVTLVATNHAAMLRNAAATARQAVRGPTPRTSYPPRYRHVSPPPAFMRWFGSWLMVLCRTRGVDRGGQRKCHQQDLPRADGCCDGRKTRDGRKSSASRSRKEARWHSPAPRHAQGLGPSQDSKPLRRCTSCRLGKPRRGRDSRYLTTDSMFQDCVWRWRESRCTLIARRCSMLLGNNEAEEHCEALQLLSHSPNGIRAKWQSILSLNFCVPRVMRQTRSSHAQRDARQRHNGSSGISRRLLHDRDRPTHIPVA
ncbi:hypothetical protein L1887_58690 [Cichorium endivia]|nr:hypothetical protein L1887_58690 [Cichorium endivia]